MGKNPPINGEFRSPERSALAVGDAGLERLVERGRGDDAAEIYAAVHHRAGYRLREEDGAVAAGSEMGGQD